MKKILFRFNAGSLNESLDTTQEVNTLEELRSIIKNKDIEFNDISIKWYCNDTRLSDWYETYIVLIDNSAIGFINEMLY